MNHKSNSTKQPLELAKTHDHAATHTPKLTVVFIHGIASSSATFAKALEYLEGSNLLKDVRFVTFDLLGAGESYAGDELNYDYQDQLEALHNAIVKLELRTPLVLVGHSMGTLIATRYANTYEKSVGELILISPPVYTEVDLTNPAFEVAIKAFRDIVSTKNQKILTEKSFNAEMKNIVLDPQNYQNLVALKTPATLIYGKMDQFIGAHNIPKLLTKNPKYLTAIETEGKHSVSQDKYAKIAKVLEEILNA